MHLYHIQTEFQKITKAFVLLILLIKKGFECFFGLVAKLLFVILLINQVTVVLKQHAKNNHHFKISIYPQKMKKKNYIRTCQTSHCETKSHRILALLDPISLKSFKSHRIFIPFNKLLFEELEINHTLAWISLA